MSETEARVAPLHRVTLQLGAKSVDGGGVPAASRPYTFIVGIGTGGLSPFEYALLDKAPGDVVELRIAERERAGTFEHLDPPLEGLWVGEALHLTAEVSTVAAAAPREIVRAMAEAGGSGCGCGCGCGG